MRRTIVGICTLVSVAAAPLQSRAQSDTGPLPADTTKRDSAAPLRPAAPTADQAKYLRGLRTVARGVAQLRSGVDGVARAETSKDTTRLRRAGRLLAGLCGTARTFMSQGRPGMQASAYQDSARVKARRLVLQVDSLIKALPTCETSAGGTPTRAAGTLLGRLRSYEAALQEFRTSVAAPTVPPPPP